MGPVWMSLLVLGFGDVALAPALAPFPVSLAIAADTVGAPVADEAWLAKQTADAQALFGPFGVRLERTPLRQLDARYAPAVETRADRDAFAASVLPGVINVFVVGSLRDVDDPTRMRRGVHWHAPSGAHYVILSREAPPSVLAHELGHFFGNAHSSVVDNVMSYERTGAPVFFDEAQGRRIVAHARAYLASGEIRPARP